MDETTRETSETTPSENRLGRSAILRRSGPLLAAALLGGGIAAGVGVAVDSDGGTTTVVRQVADTGSEPAAFAPTEGALTIREIYRRAAPGVVQITATAVADVPPDPFFDPFGLPEQQEQQSLGSGFVIDKAGHIVTNYHVVQGASEVKVNFSGGDDQVTAKVIGTDPSTDLAVLEVEAPARALTPLPLGNSDTVQVGDSLVAIGNPFGLERTVTAGIVSAVHRQIDSPDQFSIEDVIQTDAPINHGNSGGPLLNARGEVIGVNTQIATGGNPNGGNVGIGFAVPVNTVREVASQIIEDGKVEHPYVGINMSEITEALAETVRLPEKGVLILEVTAGSPADKAGLKGGDTRVIVDGQTYVLGGDVIVRVDGKEAATTDDVIEAVRSKKPGDTLTLDVSRDGEIRTVEVELGTRPTTVDG